MRHLKNYLSLLVSVSVIFVGFLYILSLNNACSSSQKKENAHIVSREDEENDIADVVFHFQIQQQLQVADRKVIFLFRADKRDPSDDFLRRVRAGKSVIKKLSQSKEDASGVKDKTTGEDGLILGVSAIKWITVNEVEAVGNVHFNRQNSLTYAYHIVKETNNKWTVKESTVIGET